MSLRGGAVSSGLCVGVCGLLLHGEGLCRHKDRFMLLVRSFIVPPMVFWGGGIPLCFTDVFSLGSIAVMGSVFCGMLCL